MGQLQKVNRQLFIVIMNRVLILAVVAAVVAAASADCGKRFHNQHLETMQQWIVGGVQALKGGYPYQVSFEYVGWFGSQQHMDHYCCSLYRRWTKSLKLQRCRWTSQPHQ